MAIRQEEIIKDIQTCVEMIHPHEIYYALRAYGIRYVHEATVDTVRACIVCIYLGIPITTSIIGCVLGGSYASVSSTKLARLGDKNVLELQGYSGSSLVYDLHSNFVPLLNRIKFELLDEIREKYTND